MKSCYLHFRGTAQPPLEISATDAATIIRCNYASVEAVELMEERLREGKRVYVESGHIRLHSFTLIHSN